MSDHRQRVPVKNSGMDWFCSYHYHSLQLCSKSGCDYLFSRLLRISVCTAVSWLEPELSTTVRTPSAFCTASLCTECGIWHNVTPFHAFKVKLQVSFIGHLVPPQYPVEFLSAQFTGTQNNRLKQKWHFRHILVENECIQWGWVSWLMALVSTNWGEWLLEIVQGGKVRNPGH